MVQLETIGTVESEFTTPEVPEKMREKKSTIVIKEEYEAGLHKIEECDYLQVIFNFHLTDDYKLKGKRRHGDERGVFASRSPRRPGAVGVTTVKLLTREGNKLRVKGLDAVDGTPVIDIKPYSSRMDELR